MMPSSVPRSQCGCGREREGPLLPLLAHHPVLGVVLADRHRRVGQVGQLQHLLVERRLGRGQLAGQLLDLLLERQARRLGLLARLAGRGAADLLGQAILLGLQRLRFVLEVAHARVARHHRVQVDGGAQALIAVAHLVGLLSQQSNIDHGRGVYRHGRATSSGLGAGAFSARHAWHGGDSCLSFPRMAQPQKADTKKPFVSDIQEIRRRAREHILNGAVTEAYRGDRETVIRLLNEALATEIVCVLRYRRHYFMASGIHAQAVAQEFLEHSNEEQGHADQIAERIVQLGGAPDLNPAGLLSRSTAEYQEGGSLIEMIREDLIAERIAIDSYNEMIRYIGDNDPTSRRMLESILGVEEEHAEDMRTLLEALGPDDAPAK